MEDSKHLSEVEVAMCADALNSNAYNTLPEYIKTHLEHCDSCASEAMVVAELAEELNEVSKGDAAPDKRFTIGRHLWAVVAVAASILFFVGVYFLNTPKKTTYKIPLADDMQKSEKQLSETHENIHKEETAKWVEENNDKADFEKIACYEPHKDLENLFQRMQGTHRSHEVEIETPAVFYPVENDTLRWLNPQSMSLYLEIFDNTENEILNHSTNTSQAPLPDLDNGLYYWKLISSDFDLLFVGKIIVE